MTATLTVPDSMPAVAEPAPVVPDTLALWAGRDEFLAWCRERGIKGVRDTTDECLVARSLSAVTGKPCSCGFDVANLTPPEPIRLPPWLGQVVRDFDGGLLPEFTE